MLINFLSNIICLPIVLALFARLTPFFPPTLVALYIQKATVISSLPDGDFGFDPSLRHVGYGSWLSGLSEGSALWGGDTWELLWKKVLSQKLAESLQAQRERRTTVSIRDLMI